MLPLFYLPGVPVAQPGFLDSYTGVFHVCRHVSSVCRFPAMEGRSRSRAFSSRSTGFEMELLGGAGGRARYLPSPPRASSTT